MKNWQFFLENQSELIPVTSEAIQISPGHYRFVGQSNLSKTPVEISLNYYQLEQNWVPVWNNRYSRLTNDQGVLILTPFLHLQPGHLHLRCQGDILTELVGKAWQYFLSVEIVDECHSQPTDTPSDDLHLRLETSTLFQSVSAIVPLRGTITSTIADYSFQGQLTYRLINPKTGIVLLNHSENCTASFLPLEFCYNLQLHKHWNTSLILGELQLDGYIGDAWVQKIANFTILEHPHRLCYKLKQIQSRVTPSPYAHLHLLQFNQAETTNIVLARSQNILPPKLDKPQSVLYPQDRIEQDFAGLKTAERYILQLRRLANSYSQK